MSEEIWIVKFCRASDRNIEDPYEVVFSDFSECELFMHDLPNSVTIITVAERIVVSYQRAMGIAEKMIMDEDNA